MAFGKPMNILAIGDVVGAAGTDYLRRVLPRLKREYAVDFCVVNGENSAPGNGVTPESAGELFSVGADVITTGNHVYRRREIYNFLDENPRILRPVNIPAQNPGVGCVTLDLGAVHVTVVNLLGMNGIACNQSNPFEAADAVLRKPDLGFVLLDIHAESTAEKCALGHYLDGKVSAVFGTHTHVQTADAQILQQGTGYITDLGMCGAKKSVLGVEVDDAISFLSTGMPTRFHQAEGECILTGCLFTLDGAGKCTQIETVRT
ncbi:MAG: YmdB family metallophosphoesterase [Oscillospiraceae bacterium]|jgi:metallophosphoesterase (TIGR00282 family)|nr:YmdB family metallophosphoesterase [Oscillospiraceae bacterium]